MDALKPQNFIMTFKGHQGRLCHPAALKSLGWIFCEAGADQESECCMPGAGATAADITAEFKLLSATDYLLTRGCF